MHAIVDLDGLAQRVGQGDYEAKTRLRQELEPGVTQIVRLVLERGTATTKLERRILQAARRLAPSAMPSANDPRTLPVAHNLCQQVVDHLWPGNTEGPWDATVT